MKNCKYCGNEIKNRQARAIYCSNKCAKYAWYEKNKDKAKKTRVRCFKKRVVKEPWLKVYHSIISRCTGKDTKYYKKGIKNFLLVEDIKKLWFRDKAYLLKRPSIDRKENNKHYTFDNCRFIELSENSRLGGYWKKNFNHQS